MTFLQTVIVTVLSGGAGALLMFRVQRRKTAAEARSIEATAALTEDDTLRRRFTDIEDLRTRVIKSEDHARLTDQDNAVLKRDNAELKDRVARLERAIPMTIAAGRLDDYASLADLFDLSADPWVFTAPNNDGTLLWVNTAFCKLLGRQREDILRLGWRQLIDPRDIPATTAAEATAWTERVWGHVNRYLHADGHPVLLKWYCPMYKGGVTLSYVSVISPRRRDDFASLGS